MSSDSDEPLSVLKNKPELLQSLQSTSAHATENKVRKLKKKKGKLLVRSSCDTSKVRYYSSHSAVEQPHDVWLYIKDLNKFGPFSCLLCSEWFINKTKLVMHYVLNHKKDYCGICRYFVENRETWVKHVKLHIPMTCSQCPEKFQSDQELRTHSITAHGSLHCRFCSFMLPEEQYHNHLYQRHSITNVANKDSSIIWATEYEGSPEFSCSLCLKSHLRSIDFYKHYISEHKFTVKCFSSMLSGFDVPFTIYGANISSEFLENALKNHAKVGYVERDKGIQTSETLQKDLLNPYMQGIKEEVLSDSENKPESLEVSFSTDQNDDDETGNLQDPDPILNYKGTEDFDVTLTEVIIMSTSYTDYLHSGLENSKIKTIAVESQINYDKVEENVESPCSLCDETFADIQKLGVHMVKMHCVKAVPSYFCRLCVTMFDTESEFRTHYVEELSEFKDLWICQFCELVFDNRESVRRHLTEHSSELKVDNCFSPHLGFKCRYCSTLFWTEVERERHQNRVHYDKYKEDFYKCTKCDERFSDKVWLVYHCSTVHSTTNQYMMKCAICCQVFATVDEVKEHFLAEHPEAKKIFCSLGVCRYRPFSQIKSFRSHVQTFHGRDAKPQAGVTCAVCQRVFASSRSCSAHANLAHGPGRFKCTICGENLQSNDERKLHQMLLHPGQRPFVCSICGKSFRHKSSLYMHREEHKPSHGQFVCKFCGKRFQKKDSFREHLLIHEGPRHTCSYCPMRFVQRSNMLRHERRHTGERPYTCDHCGRSFADKGACNSHMRIHGPHEVYPCAQCGRTFSQKAKLKYHLRKHAADKAEACPVCAEVFPSMYLLRQHIRGHETTQDLNCPHCGRLFSIARNLTRHIRMFHGADAELVTCPLCSVVVGNNNMLRYHVMTHSSIKHVKCHICSNDFSSRRTAAKHISRVHSIEGTPDTLRHLYTELDPRQCNLGLDEETITKIFGEQNMINFNIEDFATVKNAQGRDKSQEDEGVEDRGEEENSNEREEMVDEQPVAEARLRKRSKITYEYEEIEKKRKKKKKEKRREREEREQYETEPTDFVAVKLEPSDHEDDVLD